MEYQIRYEPSVEEVFSESLRADERLIWAGQPDPSIVFNKRDGCFPILGLIFTGIGLAEIWPVVRSLFSLPLAEWPSQILNELMRLGSLLFVGVGLYLLFGYFIRKRRTRSKTWYAVTDKRLMARTGSDDIQSVEIEDISWAELAMHPTGTGTIAFQFRPSATDLDTSSADNEAEEETFEFEDIHDAENVHETVTGLMAERKPEGSDEEDAESTALLADEAYKAYLAPPPRRIPVSVKLASVLASMWSCFGWVFFGFGMIFVWMLTLSADFSAPRFYLGMKTAEGTVLRVESIDFRTGDDDTEEDPVMAYTYRFTDSDGCTQEGVSYSSDADYSAGSRVTVEYLPKKPEVSRVRGMGRAPVSLIAGLLVLLFPVIGLMGILWQVRQGTKAIRLLRNGELALGRLKSKQKTETRVNDEPLYKLVFEFKAADGRTFELITRTCDVKKLEDQRQERLLYDPRNPSYAAMFDSLPGETKIDELGHIQVPQGAWLGLAFLLVVPVLSIIGHGLYVYHRFLSTWHW